MNSLLFICAYKSFLDPWWATLAAIWLNYPTCGHHVHQWILNQLSFLHGSACSKIEVWNNSPFAVGCSSMVLRGGGRLQESGIPYRPLYIMTAHIKLSRIPSVLTHSTDYGWLKPEVMIPTINKVSQVCSGVVNCPQHLLLCLWWPIHNEQQCMVPFIVIIPPWVRTTCSEVGSNSLFIDDCSPLVSVGKGRLPCICDSK